MKASQLARGLLAGGLVLCAAALAEPVAAPAPAPAAAPESRPWHDPVDAPTETMRLAARGLLLAMVEVGPKAVAVGDHGSVLVSTDRANWEQVADVPTRATLTAVAAVGNRLWAVGHDGVIIASTDAGAHWTLQRKDPWIPPAEGQDQEAKDPRQGAPLLGVLFLDENTGFAVGAYSLMLVTHDGGATWTDRRIVVHSGDENKRPELNKDGAGAWTFTHSQLAIGDEADPHFNAITRTGDGSLFIAAERGSAFRSRDQGQTWSRIKLPYDGSMFGVIGFEAQHVLAFGLRGHAFESEDLGEHWKELDTGSELSLLGGARLTNGGAVLVGANGLVLLRRNADEPLRSGSVVPASTLAAVLPSEGGAAFTVAGENGVGRYQPKGQ